MKKVKNVLKLKFFGRSEGKERGGENDFQTGPHVFLKILMGYVDLIFNYYCMIYIYIYIIYS
jgi:hypothetical protein